MAPRAHVHYLPLGLGIDQYCDPLQDADSRIDEIVLLVPEDHALPEEFEAVARDKLEEATGATVSDPPRRIEEYGDEQSDDFVRLVARAYDELLDRFEKRDTVAINMASMYWHLSAAYALAGSYIIAEVMQGNRSIGRSGDVPAGYPLDTAMARPHDHLELYYTQPTQYQLDELFGVADQVLELRQRFARTQESAGNLRDDVEEDIQTVKGLNALLVSQGGDSGGNFEKIMTMIESIGADEEFVQALENIVEGIEKVTAGIDTLAKDEHRAFIEDGIPDGIGPAKSMADGLLAVANRPTGDSEELAPTHLLEYFIERLERVGKVLGTIESPSGESQAQFDRTPGELAQQLRELKRRGIAVGAHQFGDSTRTAVPGPAQFRFQPVQRAILYTLNEAEGSVESIRALTAQLVRQAIAVEDETTVGLSEHPLLDALRAGKDVAPSEIADTVINVSTVQDNLGGLEANGLVKRQPTGQSTGIKFTRAGTVYAAARDFDSDWQRVAFNDVREKMEKKIS